MNNLQSLSNQIQELQAEYNKKMAELNRELEVALHLEITQILSKINVEPKDSIAIFNLSNRANIILKKMGVTTISDLLKLTKTDLLAQPNFGKKLLTEMERLFEDRLGLELPY